MDIYSVSGLNFLRLKAATFKVTLFVSSLLIANVLRYSVVVILTDIDMINRLEILLINTNKIQLHHISLITVIVGAVHKNMMSPKTKRKMIEYYLIVLKTGAIIRCG